MLIIDNHRKILILIVIIIPFLAHADSDAESLFEAGDWAKAADAYQLRAAADPEDARAWFRLAASARQAGRYAIARDALVRAEELKFSPVRIGFERARLDVLTNDRGAALGELQAVAASGFTAVQVITGDPLLNTLAGEPAYDALVDDMSRKAFPCEHDPSFSEFDFWIGEWDVHTADGTFAGSNVIEPAQRGCVLIENWSSAGGGSGTSINYVDKVTGEWVQVWNDASGGQINIRGGMTDNGMLLTGTIHYVANGTTADFRGIWTPMPDGRVRQFFEQKSSDDEKWTPWFEGFYTKKPARQAGSRNRN
jgi:hypothetical protein